MPTYDYECDACGHSFDAFQSMSDEPLKKCPKCGKMKLRRLIGGGLGVIFKGSGFYVNDSKSGGGTKKSESKASGTSSTSGETKSTDSAKSGDSSGASKKKAEPSKTG